MKPDLPAAAMHRNLPLLLLLLLKARDSVTGHFRPLLKAHGLTEPPWRILRVLHAVGALERRQIKAIHARIEAGVGVDFINQWVQALDPLVRRAGSLPAASEGQAAVDMADKGR
jgi:hypothetical protein